MPELMPDKKMAPKVSIIMPILNGQKYMGEAIESILNQTCQDFELIIVNDGSTDGTADQIQYYMSRANVRCIVHPTRQGVARSVNDGIRESHGEFISFLDHDDVWFPEFLETQMAHLRDHPDVGMVHSDFQTIDADGNILEASVATCRNRQRPSGHVFRELFLDSFIVGNSVLIRKECFERLGGFDEVIRWGDYHMWMRIARHYKVDYTPKVLTKYRQHGTQHSKGFSVEDPHMEPAGLMAIRNILEIYPRARQELGRKTINRRTAELLFELAYFWFTHGAARPARVPLAKAIRLWPTNRRFYVLYAATLLPPSLAEAGRKIWHALQRMLHPFRKNSWRHGLVGIHRDRPKADSRGV